MYFREHSPKSTLGTILSQPELIAGCIDAQRVGLGLAPAKPRQILQYSPQLHIQASSPELEFGQALHPTEYVGPLVSPLNGTSSALPDWWGEVVAASEGQGGVRVVGITQGTFATDPSSLLLPAIRALRDDASLLLVVPSQQAEEIKQALLSDDGDGSGSGGQSLPTNLRLAAWLPYEALLPRCSVLVTNGGYGSVTQALAHGVPLVCAGTSEDKKDTAARVTHAGAGVDLGTDCPSTEQVRDAVAGILGDARYRENAARVGRGLNSLGGAARACELLEGLVGGK
jgi:UDP:flavonoid glycosyltransferase YjiC (YdhE family)